MFYDGFIRMEVYGTEKRPLLSKRLEVDEWVWNI